MEKNYKRMHLRAPVKTNFLYEDDGNVFKSSLLNISKGGVLIKNLPHIPQSKSVFSLIGLPNVPIFEKISDEELVVIEQNPFEKKIFRVKLILLRSEKKANDLNELFVENIGAKFENLSIECEEAIKNYVQDVSKNIIYLLSFFKKSNLNDSEIKRIKILSLKLGYGEDYNLNELFQIMWRDYQSLLVI